MTGFVRHVVVLFYVDHISVPPDHLGSFNGFGTGLDMCYFQGTRQHDITTTTSLVLSGQIYLTRIRDTNLGSDFLA